MSEGTCTFRGWGTTSRSLRYLKVHVRYCVRTYLLYGTAYCTVLRKVLYGTVRGFPMIIRGFPTITYYSIIYILVYVILFIKYYTLCIKHLVRGERLCKAGRALHKLAMIESVDVVSRTK